MEHCPVCNMPVQTAICPECGFDSSRNYEKLPTLGFAVNGTLLAVGLNEDEQCDVHALMP